MCGYEILATKTLFQIKNMMYPFLLKYTEA